MREREVRPSMGLLSLLHDILEDDALWCNLLHFKPWRPIVPELFLWFPVSEPPQFCIRWFGGFVGNFFVSESCHCWVVCLDWRLRLRPTHFNECIAQWYNRFYEIYSADISDSASDAITVLMIFAIFNTDPLSFDLGSFSERNICAPDLLLVLDSLRKPASVCAANIISLFLKRIPSLG